MREDRHWSLDSRRRTDSGLSCRSAEEENEERMAEEWVVITQAKRQDKELYRFQTVWAHKPAVVRDIPWSSVFAGSIWVYYLICWKLEGFEIYDRHCGSRCSRGRWVILSRLLFEVLVLKSQRHLHVPVTIRLKVNTHTGQYSSLLFERMTSSVWIGFRSRSIRLESHVSQNPTCSWHCPLRLV